MSEDKELSADERTMEMERLKSEKQALAKVDTKPKDEAKSVRDDKAPAHKDLVVQGSIRIVSESGKSDIVLSVRDETAGLWIQSSSKNDRYPKSLVALYDDEHQGPVIGFYRDTGEQIVMDCALAMGINGPMLQVSNGRGGAGSISISELLDKVKPDWR